MSAQLTTIPNLHTISQMELDLLIKQLEAGCTSLVKFGTMEQLNKANELTASVIDVYMERFQPEAYAFLNQSELYGR